ncbi:SusC/RagA family TonB-linked outer membrane protein [Tenacibaculum sp.]|uniref:SusC/RagA family TonB-linked outer membrane protein n=1 Tax=Tenacibaculum sp. TaxID=1906242 RepID=UPI003AA7CAD8
MRTKFNGILTLFLALIVQISFAQEKTISGTVSDESGPLPGVTILKKGTSQGTETDFDGNYSIKAKTGDILVFSFIGMKTVEKTIGLSNSISIMMVNDNVLDEVVVTAFGIKRNPKKLTYAVSKVETDEIVNNSEPDLVRSLNGKVAGVNINTSTGVAGASNFINIRGATSLSSSSQPLIIVDGVAYDNSQVTSSSQTTGGGGYESGLSTLDPNNIASVNVLKSTAASALYGSRATNGVIVITTKTGSSNKGGNKMNINVNSGVYFDQVANLPDYQNTYGNGVNFGYVNANGSWGPRFDSLDEIPTWNNLLNAFPDKFGPTVPYVAQPNNVEDLFRTGTVLDNSVGFSYGSDKGSFNATISNLDQEGYIPFNSYTRNALGVGGNFELDNKITIGASLNYTTTNQVGGFFGENQFSGSASSFARALWLGRTWDLSLPYEHPLTGASVTPNNGWDHPLWSWKHDRIITNSERVVTNLSVSYPFNDNISTSFRLGVNKYTLNRDEIRDIGSRAADGLGSLYVDNFTNEDIESTLIVNFNDYKLSKNINFDALVGLNTLQNTIERHSNQGTVFSLPNIYNLTNTVNVSNVNDRYDRQRTVGVFGEMNFSFKDYLFLTLTGRNDWSSTLPLDNRSFFYPSVSSSLIFSDAFNIKSDVLTYGKIRAGYAEAGKPASAEFLNRTFAIGTPYSSYPTIGNRTSLGDQQIKPEFTKEFEVGTDLEFFNRRIALDFTWYKKTTSDLISGVVVPTSSGFRRYNTNIGEIVNQGYEFGLDLVPLKTDDFKWSLYTTFTKNENEVTELVEGLDRIPFDPNQTPHAIKGQPFGVFYGTRFLRDDEGNYMIDPTSGGIRPDTESGIIGDPNPDFKMSFTNTLTYKSFSLKVLFDWKEGGDIQSTSIPSLLGRGVTKDTENREGSFIIPGYYVGNDNQPLLDVNGDKIPNTTQVDMNELYFSPDSNRGNTFGQNSVDEAAVYDATVYRLRELSLTYSMPKKWLENTPFGKVNLSFVGNNLWFFAPNVPKHTNFDPDVTAFGSSLVQGIEVASAPTSRRYGMKLSITF